jgi:hypothetical protein
MSQVLQNSRRKPRPWTAQEQVTAEVAAACGVSMYEIGKALNRGHAHIRTKLSTAFREEKIAYDNQYYDRHREESCAAARQWYAANRDQALIRHRAWHANNRDQHNAKKRAWWHANNARAKAAQRRWRENNRERHLESGRQWRLKNTDRHRQNARKWRDANIDRVKENCRQWRIRNLEYVKSTVREWRKDNREACREYGRRRSALIRAGRRRALQPVTLSLRMQRFAVWANTCAYCCRNGAMEADHVLALNAQGVHELSNIVPACRRCNASKRDHPVESWYRAQPFFDEARWAKIQRHCPAAVVGQLPLALPA